ncbi:hypothetical protein L873DRAFT_1756950 [Choiromyces venosus 120613-1]|uniref:Uncharacterized protein n=1 Tax=Choiromyces venosus 120613-1 TaxID=1336337 RepID=A0A3N4K8Q1_9PEZI|nr:hypothetical protein L873DRAFT_1756950 [Choiromyces venosus 120613-1]
MAASATLSFLMEKFDKRVADKPTREKFYHDVVEFSYHQPFIAAFVLLQLMFSLLPLLGFLSFSLGVVIITLGICGFWIGVGLCVLFSTLVFTATIATVVWLCACASFISARWSTQLVSGAPTGVKQYAIKGSDKKEDRVPRDKPAAVKRPERKLQENIPPYRETTVVKSVDTADESGSDTGSGKSNGQKVPTPPGDTTQPPPLQTSSEAEKLRRDIERSLR